MPLQLTVTLISYSCGIVSGIFFSYGTAFPRLTDMAELCEPHWDYHSKYANALALQSAQYLTGALFLLASFVLQVLAALIEPDTQPILLPEKANSFAVAMGALVVLAFLAREIQRRLVRWRRPALKALLRKRLREENLKS